MALLLTEDGNQHVGAVNFFLTTGLNVKHGALQDALKSKGRLGFSISLVLRNQWRGGLEELSQFGTQLLDICATGIQNSHCRGVVEQGQ